MTDLNVPYTCNAFIQSLAGRLPETSFGEERMDYVRRCVAQFQESTIPRNIADAALLRWHSDEAARLIQKLRDTNDIAALREACIYILKQQVKA